MSKRTSISGRLHVFPRMLRHKFKKHCQRHNGPRILSPKLELSLKAQTNANSTLALLAFLHSLVTTLSSYSVSMTTVTSQWSNNIYCRQHDYSSPAHQLQYSVELLYHHLADHLGDLQAHIGLDHHLNDNHQPQIALLASSASIELVSSSARVTSVKFHKGLVCMYIDRDTGTHRPDPRDTWVR